MEKLVLIDGHSILNRAFYGVPELTNSEGLHTNAVYGFLNIMFRILEEEKADHLAVAFDLHEPTFRHKMYAEYKGTRKPMPEELREQVPLMKDILEAMEIPVVTLAGYEADDILGTLAKRMAGEGKEVSVVSGDRDLLQLADEHIKIRIPKTNRNGTEVKDYYPEDVKREYQVTPQEFIDVKALMGDSSDNIPGVPSIGEKTATNLIVTYGNIENAYAHLEEIRPPRAKKALAEHYDMAVMSKELATICLDCPIDFSYEDAKIENLYTPAAYQYMKRLNFRSILSRFDAGQMGGCAAEEHFWLIEEYAGTEQLFERASEAERVGFQLIDGPEGIEGLGICFGEEDCYAVPVSGLVTGVYLCDKLKELLQKLVGRNLKNTEQDKGSGISPYVAIVPDLKSQLPYLKLDYGAPVMDAKVAGYLLNPLKDAYDYDDIARDYLDLTVPSRSDLLGKEKLGAALRGGEERAVSCACYLGYIAWKSMPVLTEKLKEQGLWELFETMEMPLIYSLFHMESTGIRVDKEQLKRYGEQLRVKIDRLEKEIYELAGEQFNINSPKQLGEVLFDHLKLPHGKKTRTGYSTAAEVLEKLAPDYPLVQRILDYRQLAKLNSTYAEGLAVYIGDDGRIHGTFNQTITATGRISSTEPNLQNIPVRMDLGREIRKVFVPAEGCVFVDADYSQIELRILAHMSGDARLIRAYGEAQDIHAITASEVFHIPMEQVTPLQRRNAKAVNFGIVYGISAFGLSEDLSISRQEALEYINKYFETYPGIKTFLDKQVEDGKEKGYVTTMFGRRRPIPELKSANYMQRSFGERVAMNSPIQGTAADIMKLAMIAVDQELQRQGLKSRIVLQIHDELLVEAPRQEAAKVVRILEDCMKHAADLKVALEVEAHQGASWFDTKEEPGQSQTQEARQQAAAKCPKEAAEADMAGQQPGEEPEERFREFTIRRAEPGDVDAIAKIMEIVRDSMEQPEWFVADDRAWVESHIQDQGFTMVAETAALPAEIAAFFIVAFPKADENNLGQELKLNEEQLLLTAHMDSAAVLPLYRGNHLQGRLLEAAERELCRYPHQYLLATVHPENHASLHTMLRHGYVIVATKEKYHGRLRHILYKKKEAYQTKPNILVSACLLGTHCRYDGSGVREEWVKDLMADANLIPVCPEILGGLATPRDPAEQSGSRVITKCGEDVTAQYQKGAAETLALAQLFGCRLAILKERSPSCGSGMVYDGTHSGTLTEGDGMTARLLKANNIQVLGESEEKKIKDVVDDISKL